MKKIFKNIFFLGSSDLISRFLSFLSIIFLARNFGPEGMGLLAASLSFLTIGNVLSELGLPIWGTKIISQLKMEVPTFKKDKLPTSLKSVPISTPGSRFIK